jgi:phosphate-selective porin OprO/OprP
MKYVYRLITVFSLLTAFSGHAFADTADLEKRLDALEQEVAVLKRQLEIEKESKVQKATETPIITANAKDGFSIKSPDDNFKFRIGGYVQADARIFTNNKKDGSGGTTTFLVRRARPIFQGTVVHDFNFYVMPDLASSTSGAPILVDAYGEYVKVPWLKLRAGKFKAPFSIENLQSTPVTNFAELGLPSNLYPSRDIGIQLSGGFFNDALSYGVGYFNGQNDRESSNSAIGNTDTNNDKSVVGRLFVQPFKNTSFQPLAGLGAGYAASYEHQEGSTLPTFISPGQLTVFSYGSSGTPGTTTNIHADGARIRTSPQASYYYKSLGVLGEYVDSAQEISALKSGVLSKERFHNKAWQVSGSYVLTGEDAAYTGVKPRHSFDPQERTWGAFELVGRYGELFIDHNIFDQGFSSLTSSVSGEKAWAVGLNWYVNNNIKWLLDFEQTKFDRGNSATVGAPEDRKIENVITSRLQLVF